MIKNTTKKKVKKASSKKANPGKDWIRHADLRPKGGGRNSDEHKYSDEKSNQEYYAKLHRLAEDIQWEKRDEYPIHGYPWHRALEDASELLAKKKANPKKCRTIKVRRKISMGKGKRPRILQVKRKVCNPGNERLVLTYGKLPTEKQFLDHYDHELLGSDFRIVVNSPQKNKWDRIHGDFTSTQLWNLLKLAKKEDSTASLNWISNILETLNIEWV